MLGGQAGGGGGRGPKTHTHASTCTKFASVRQMARCDACLTLLAELSAVRVVLACKGAPKKEAPLSLGYGCSTSISTLWGEGVQTKHELPGFDIPKGLADMFIRFPFETSGEPYEAGTLMANFYQTSSKELGARDSPTLVSRQTEKGCAGSALNR